MWSGLRSGKVSRHNWIENERLVDVFDAKRDAIQSLVEAGFNQNKLYIDDISDVDNLKYTDMDKQKLILPTENKEFMNLYDKVINKINFDDLKGLFPRSKNSILKTKPK